MARNDTFIAAPPDRVYEVLSDAHSYGHWVVGSDKVRSADPDFPAPGTRFHHQVLGLGPIKVRDHTTVVDSNPPRCLILLAKARPLGTARVSLWLAPERAGTRVTMQEEAGNLLTKLFFNPLMHLLVRGRNDESLRRLKELAEAP